MASHAADENFPWGRKKISDVACLNSPRNYAKCGEAPIQLFSKEYFYFMNSNMVSDVRGEFVFLGELQDNISDFYAKEIGNETLFYFIDEEDKIRKAFMPHLAGQHDHITMSRAPEFKLDLSNEVVTAVSGEIMRLNFQTDQVQRFSIFFLYTLDEKMCPRGRKRRN